MMRPLEGFPIPWSKSPSVPLYEKGDENGFSPLAKSLRLETDGELEGILWKFLTQLGYQFIYDKPVIIPDRDLRVSQESTSSFGLFHFSLNSSHLK
jgi:hypothetical protein